MASHQRICEIVLLSLLALVPFVCNQTAAPTTNTTDTGTPGTDTTTEDLTAIIDSSTGKGSRETTNLPRARLCVVGDNSTKANCGNLKNEILAYKFHASDGLRNLTDGVCSYLTDGPPKNDSSDTKIIRCVYSGEFTKQNGQPPDVCRLHFFNEDPATTDVIHVVGYWGRVNLPTDLVYRPIP